MNYGGPVCFYCGDTASEWDHLRPVVRDRRPTGYITEIPNLSQAVEKCNQSKGNGKWRIWILWTCAILPTIPRGSMGSMTGSLDLRQFETWDRVSPVDLRSLVGDELWEALWEYHEMCSNL
jgi:hypothetical protein